MRWTAQGLLFLVLTIAAWADPSVEPARIRHDTVLRDVVLTVKGKAEAEPVQRRFDVVVLENRYLQILVCPELGERIVNVVDKTTGKECLFEGTIRYSGSAYTEGGGSGGGLQVNHPLYHAGSSYVAPLPYTTKVDADGTAIFTLARTSYPHLQHTVWQIRLRNDEAAFRCTYRFENLAPFAMGFNPWINAAFPMRHDAQFVLPADWIAGHWFGINAIGDDGDWGHHLRPWPVDADGVDQSHLKDRKWSAAFAYGLTGGHAGIYYHDTNEGFVHVFDPDAMPGAKAAGAWSTNGWLEVWGAFTHNMEDPRWLEPHGTVQATDLWFPVHAIGGITWANEHGALNLRKEGDRLHCGIYMLRRGGAGAVRVTADGNPLLQARIELDPAAPLFRTISCPAETDELRVVVMDGQGRVLIERQRFFSERPRRQLVLPDVPWHSKTLVTEARWQEAFTPLMGWGPWYHPTTTYAKALAATPGDVEAQIGLARSLVKEAAGDLFRRRRSNTQEQLYERASVILADLARSPAADPRAIRLLGLVQSRTRKAEQAAKTLSQLAGTPGDAAVVRYQLGLLAASSGDWPRAVSEAQTALALAPDSTLSRLLLTIGLLRTGKPGAVRAILAPVLEANPADIRSLLLLHQAAEATDRADEVKRLSAELARLKGLASVQYDAAVAAIDALQRGSDLDCRAVDTTVGPAALPGREP